MKIRTVEFAGAIAGSQREIPGALPQVAFAGRSNVGKSSLINRLLGRTRTPIARVSGQPGKTQEINFFRVDAFSEEDGAELDFFLVDLPGYGFAKVPKALRDAWKPLIEGYLSSATDLKGVVQLIDVRHSPTAEDRTMIEFLASLGIPALVVLTKVDKLKKAERAKRLSSTVQALELDMDQVVPFSSQTGEGREVLMEALESLLREPTP